MSLMETLIINMTTRTGHELETNSGKHFYYIIHFSS